MDINNLYKNGYPWSRDEFTECLDEQAEKRIDINMASVILIDGGQGQGKTTLAVHIADHHNKRKGLPPIDLSVRGHKQIGLGGVDFISKFNKCKRENLPVLIYDEAGDYSKASTLSWFNYQLSKLFQKIRSAKIIVLLCLPNFNILDNRLFDDEIIRGAIHCHGRQMTINYGNFDVYDMDQLSWIRYWYSKLPSARRKACYGMVSPLFQSHFKNLPPTRAKKLEILSNFGKEKERQEAEVNMRGLLDYKALASETNRTEQYIRQLVHRFNINSAETIGRKAYFDKGALKRLEKYFESKQK